MTCTVFRIEAAPQTGKSLIVTGALKQVQREGGKVAILARTRDFARCLCERFGIECDYFGPSNAVPWGKYSAVAIDDADDLTTSEINGFREKLDRNIGPTMLLVVTTIKNSRESFLNRFVGD